MSVQERPRFRHGGCREEGVSHGFRQATRLLGRLHHPHANRPNHQLIRSLFLIVAQGHVERFDSRP